MDSRDGLPRGALPSGILKIRKNVQALKFGSPSNWTITRIFGTLTQLLPKLDREITLIFSCIKLPSAQIVS